MKKAHITSLKVAGLVALTLGLDGCGDEPGDGPTEPNDVIVNITGNYVDLTSSPIQGAVVRLTVGSLNITATTEVDGGFSFAVTNPSSNSGQLDFTKSNTTPKTLALSVSGTPRLGNVQGNIGPTITSTPPPQELTVGDTLTLDLNAFVSNDDQSDYEPRDTDFAIQGTNVVYTATAVTPVSTWIDVMDRTDANLRDSVLVDVNVLARPNTAPEEINPVGDQTTNEDSALQLDMSEFVADEDGDSLSYLIETLPDASYSSAGEILTITPDADYYGTIDSIVVAVSDGTTSTDLTPFSLIVNPVNDAPVFADTVPSGVTVQDSTFTIDASGYFSDVDDDSLSYAVLNLGSNASYSASEGVITITPDAGWSGTLSGLVLQANDTAMATAESNEFDIDVQPPINQEPVQHATIGAQSVDEDGTLELLMSSFVNDPDGDTLVYTISSLQDATYDVIGDTLRITPAADYYGSIPGITINADDGTNALDLNAFDLTVTPVNDVPYPIW